MLNIAGNSGDTHAVAPEPVKKGSLKPRPWANAIAIAPFSPPKQSNGK